MEIAYIKCGDYYIPDLTLPEEPRPMGKWGADAPGIPEGNVSHHLHQSDSVWEALDLSCGPERTGAAAAGHAGVPDEGCRRNHRSTESQRPDAMGAADEQHPGQGGGNSP